MGWIGCAIQIAGNYETAPTICFSYFQHIFLYYLINNPKTTIALTFLTHNISGIGGVKYHRPQ